jgi:hypothetical protein
MAQIRIICALLVTLLITSNAEACLWPGAEVQTFLNTLPKDAMNRDIVARVKIISEKTHAEQGIPVKILRVEVIEPLKGTTLHQILNVRVDTHDCAVDSNVKLGEAYFVAGSINAAGILDGSWQGLGPVPGGMF